MLTADFSEGFQSVVTEPAYQYDTGISLCIGGISQLIADTQVHFDCGGENALVKPGVYNSQNGTVTASVPDAFFERASESGNRAWVYVPTNGGDFGYTVKTIYIPVIQRLRPESYTAPDDESVMGQVTRALAMENRLTEKADYLLKKTNEYAAGSTGDMSSFLFETDGDKTALYFKGKNGGEIYIRGNCPDLNISSSTGNYEDTANKKFLKNAGFDSAYYPQTAPSGAADCLKIPNNYSLVYNYNSGALAIVLTNTVYAYGRTDHRYLVIFSVNNGAVCGGVGLDLYNKWLKAKADSLFAAETPKTEFLLKKTNEFAYSQNKLYFEEASDGIYITSKLGDTITIRGGAPDVAISFGASASYLDKAATRYIKNTFDQYTIGGKVCYPVTSPKNVTNCLKLPNGYCLVYDYSGSSPGVDGNNEPTTLDGALAIVPSASLRATVNSYRYLPIFDVAYGKIVGGIGLDIYNKWTETHPYITKLNEHKKAQAKSIGYRPNAPFSTENTYDNMSVLSVAPKKTDLRFIFATDLHKSIAKCDRIISLINNWGTDLVDVFINGGDTIGNPYDSSRFEWYSSLLENLSVPSLNAVGNHDAYSSSSGTLAEQSEVNSLFAPTITDESVVRPSGKNYYYRDYNSKIRVIVLDFMFWDSTQNEWLENVLSDARDNALHVMIVTHAPFLDSYTAEIDSSWNSKMKGYRDGTVTNYNAAIAVADFIHAGGIFIGWFMGHTHSDELLFTNANDYGVQPMFLCASPTPSRSWTSTILSTDDTQYNYDTMNYVSIDTVNKLVKILKIGADTDYFGSKREILVWDYENGREVKCSCTESQVNSAIVAAIGGVENGSY